MGGSEITAPGDTNPSDATDLHLSKHWICPTICNSDFTYYIQYCNSKLWLT